MKTQRQLLNLVPRVAKHPTHAVVDGVRYGGGLEEYRRVEQAIERLEATSRRIRAKIAARTAAQGG